MCCLGIERHLGLDGIPPKFNHFARLECMRSALLRLHGVVYTPLELNVAYQGAFVRQLAAREQPPSSSPTRPCRGARDSHAIDARLRPSSPSSRTTISPSAPGGPPGRLRATTKDDCDAFDRRVTDENRRYKEGIPGYGRQKPYPKRYFFREGSRMGSLDRPTSPTRS